MGQPAVPVVTGAPVDQPANMSFFSKNKIYIIVAGVVVLAVVSYFVFF